MSLIGGTSQSGADVAGLDESLAALAYGPDEPRDLWREPHIALGWVNEGEIFRTGRSAVLVEGWFERRPSLLSELDATDACPAGELLWRAWKRWGHDFLEPIYGEFSCALWDAERQLLVMGRDALGLRELFYRLDDEGLRFASECRGLWRDIRSERQVSDKGLAHWLALKPMAGPVTFYEDVFRVLSGHIAIWDGKSVVQHRYWRPERLAWLNLPSDEAYVEALREKFEAAVRRRLPSRGEVAAHLSGGLDSSAVCVVAAKLLAEEGRTLTAYTAAPRHPVDDSAMAWRIGDEFPAAARIAALYPNLRHLRVDNDALPAMATLHRHFSASDMPLLNMFNGPWMVAIENDAARRGMKVMLTGEMGNLTFSYDGWLLLAGLLRSGRLSQLFKTWLEIRKGPERKGWLNLISITLTPFLSRRATRLIRGLLGKKEYQTGDYTAVRPEFAAQQGLNQASIDSTDPRTISDSRAIRLWVISERSRMGGRRSVARRLDRIEVADPTLDRELVEFLLSVPDDQFLHRGQARSLARRFLKGMLPDDIIAERRKGLQAADWAYAFDAARPEIAQLLDSMENSPLTARAIDVPRLKALLAQWPGPEAIRGEKALLDYAVAFGRSLSTAYFVWRLEGRND